jgi:serine/threonine protein kinase
MQPRKIDVTPESHRKGDSGYLQDLKPLLGDMGAIAPIDESGSCRAELFPEKLGPYRIGHEVGGDPEAGIYTGTSLVDGRPVMIKIPSRLGDEYGLGAKKEFRALRQISHKGVVKAQRLFRWRGQFAFVTEALHQRSLDRMVRGNRPVGELPDLSRLTDIASKMFASLACIHRMGWVHGAIRPEKVLFNDASDPVWTDLSHSHSYDVPFWLPADKRLVANSPCLAPELIVGPPVDTSADMFAMGRILGLLLLGKMPRWLPGEAIGESDKRVKSQLPSNTPAKLVELCSKLVRMAPVQRPTAETAYQWLTGQDLADLGESESSPDLQKWLEHTKCIAEQSFQRAANNQGSVILLTSEQQRLDRVNSIFCEAPSDDARLVLSGRCDCDEQTPLPGFDAMLDLLAKWFQQLSPTLRNKWGAKYGESIQPISPSIARSLGMDAPDSMNPTREALDRASIALCELFADLASERNLVLIIHQVEQMDAASGQLLNQLAAKTMNSPIILVTTTQSSIELVRNHHAANLINKLSVSR